MTNEEAIKHINELMEEENYLNTYSGASNALMNIALDLAIEALEKQIPKKVIKIIIPKGYGGISCRCPNCNSGNVDVKFCLECGQKLDW